MRATLLILLLFATAGCNTVRGAKEDARSVGRVFSSHPEGSASSPR